MRLCVLSEAHELLLFLHPGKEQSMEWTPHIDKTPTVTSTNTLSQEDILYLLFNSE